MFSSNCIGQETRTIIKTNGTQQNGKWMVVSTSQQAIHHLDIIRYLNDDVVETSSCQFNLINSLEAEDTMIGMVKYKNGKYRYC